MKNLFLFSLILSVISAASCATQQNLRQSEQKNVETSRALLLSNQENAQLHDSLTVLQLQFDELNKINSRYKVDLTAAGKAEQSASQRYLELSRCLDGQSDTLQAIKRKAIQDLSSFDNSVVDVNYRNGMVYISLQEQFMFKSGSTRINPGGKKALSVIANILAEYNGVTAIVVGNTDSIKIVRGYKDNWSLSTERANAIVRYLLSDYGTDPARLIAAGKSRFNPVASNEGETGRAKNRRTDIIINPNLNKLWLLSQKYP